MLGWRGSKKPLVLFGAVVAGTQPADMSSTSFFGAKRSFLKSTGFLNVPGTTTSLAHCCAFKHVFVGRRGRRQASYMFCAMSFPRGLAMRRIRPERNH